MIINDFFEFVELKYNPFVHISKIDADLLKGLYFQFAATLSEDPIFMYCVERCIMYNGIENIENWDTTIQEFYYGCEVTDINFKKHQDILKDIQVLSQLNKNLQIEYALIKEYSYLLDWLKNKKWSIYEVEKEKIKGNPTHQKQLDVKYIKKYENYDMPKCLLCKHKDHFRIIDGYHRWAAAANEEKIKCIVAE